MRGERSRRERTGGEYDECVLRSERASMRALGEAILEESASRERAVWRAHQNALANGEFSTAHTRQAARPL